MGGGEGHWGHIFHWGRGPLPPVEPPLFTVGGVRSRCPCSGVWLLANQSCTKPFYELYVYETANRCKIQQSCRY